MKYVAQILAIQVVAWQDGGGDDGSAISDDDNAGRRRLGAGDG
jgi:hypothetical protein